MSEACAAWRGATGCLEPGGVALRSKDDFTFTPALFSRAALDDAGGGARGGGGGGIVAAARCNNGSGFQGRELYRASKPFQASSTAAGAQAPGCFATAEEAALAVARASGRRASQQSRRRSAMPSAASLAARSAAPMTAAEEHAAAAEEGLRCAPITRRLHGREPPRMPTKLFKASSTMGATTSWAYSRRRRRRRSVARFSGPRARSGARATRVRAHDDGGGGHAAAEAEGPTPLRAENLSGFKGVNCSHTQQSIQGESEPRRARKPGHFATAEEAALAVARLGPEGVAARAAQGPRR